MSNEGYLGCLFQVLTTRRRAEPSLNSATYPFSLNFQFLQILLFFLYVSLEYTDFRASFGTHLGKRRKAATLKLGAVQMRVNLVDTEKKQLTPETSLAKFGVDTTENGPSEGLATSYLPRPPPPSKINNHGHARSRAGSVSCSVVALPAVAPKPAVHRAGYYPAPAPSPIW